MDFNFDISEVRSRLLTAKGKEQDVNEKKAEACLSTVQKQCNAAASSGWDSTPVWTIPGGEHDGNGLSGASKIIWDSLVEAGLNPYIFTPFGSVRSTIVVRF